MRIVKKVESICPVTRLINDEAAGIIAQLTEAQEEDRIEDLVVIYREPGSSDFRFFRTLSKSDLRMLGVIEMLKARIIDELSEWQE